MKLLRSIGILGGVFLLSALLFSYSLQVDPNAMNLLERFQGPGWNHIWGTDALGRDLFARCIAGIGTSCLVIMGSLMALLGISLLGGFFLSLLKKGFYVFFHRLLTSLQSIPQFLLAMVGSVILPARPMILGGMIGGILSLQWLRFVATIIKNRRNKDDYLASRALGASWPHLFWFYELPELLNNASTITSYVIPHIIMMESFLSFLGFGLNPPQISLGGLCSEGFRYLNNQSHLFLFPSLCLCFGLFFLGLKERPAAP